MDINQYIESKNIAEELDAEVLSRIGSAIVDGYTEDLRSREEWERRYEQALKLASQVLEHKSHPWPNASNVKYPLLTTASVQFSARAYPALIPGQDVVRCKITGEDPEGIKASRAYRVGKHMSYQVLEEMEGWEEDMDRLLIMLPITGTEFKKTYFDATLGRNKSEHVLAKDLVVNYYAKSLETAQRKTHVFELSKNEVKERKLKGLYREIDFGSPDLPQEDASNKTSGVSPPADESTRPYIFLECHCFWDLDGDGYEEPYVITVHLASRKVARIVARFDIEGVELDDQGRVVGIQPVEYFTKFSFIPSIDGGFYDIGFGHILAPINEAINTNINQLVDAGTLSNMQGGFLSKGIRLRAGQSSFKPGEWKMVDTTGDDLRKGIFPLPVREPSQTLFQLLGMLTQAGERLASVTDILLGENPGQNQPATTTMAVIEQGLKVFTAIYKRQYRALKSEYRKLYRLNRLYLPDEMYFRVLDLSQEQVAVIGRRDYLGDDTDIQPFADPNVVSETQRLTKAGALVESLNQGAPANPLEVWRRYYEALQIPDVDSLLPKEMPPTPVDPKVEVDRMKVELDARHKDMEHQLAAQKEEFARAMAIAGNEIERNRLEIEQFRAQTERLKAMLEKRNQPEG